MRLLLVVIILVALLPTAAFARPQKVCIAEGGKLIVRKRCRMNEAVAYQEPSVTAVLSDCRPVYRTKVCEGFCTLAAACGVNEFLLNKGFDTEVRDAYLTESKFLYLPSNDKFPIGVYYRLYGHLPYTLNITITCCPVR